MMYLNALREKISKFNRNEDGNIFITTAILSPLLVLVIGVGADTAEIYRNKVNFHNALDAGTVYATKVFASTGDRDKAEESGRRIFNANMGNTTETYKEFQITNTAMDCSSGKIIGKGKMRHPIFFSSVYDMFSDGPDNEKGEVTLTAVTEVACSNSTVELAMVLDVSNSMKGTPNGDTERKIDSLETAATNLVNKLHTAFLAHPNPNALKISVVPFAGMVNIGKNNRTAPWMDTDGEASYHHEDLGWSAKTGQTELAEGGWEDTATGERLTRFTLFDQLDEEWAGCVIHRPYPQNVTDSEPDPYTADTLFVPAFAPDTPDKLTGAHWVGNNGNGNNGNNGNGNNGNKLVITGEEKYSNDYLYDFNNSAYEMSEDNTGVNQWKRLNWPMKYFKDKDGNAQVMRKKVDKKEIMGPNHYCVTQPIIPLTSNQETVTDLLGDMAMGFGTEVHQGILWGWRALSSGAPFTQGRNYNAAYNKKVMVVMSDGANYMGEAKIGGRSDYPGSQYFAHGFTKNKRLWEGTSFAPSGADTLANFRTAMNELQMQTCDNAKNAGITIYTIAFAIKEDSDRADTMKYCASLDSSGKPLYMTADDGNELFAAFEKIATDMGEITVIK